MTALHDSRNPFYRTPSGARPTGEKVTLRLRAEAGAKVYLRLWWNDAEQKLPMKSSMVEDGLFEITLALPKEPGLLWYYFIVETKDGKTFEFTVYNIAQWLEKGNRALAGEFGSLEVSAPAPQAAPAGPAPSGSYVAELKQLKELLDAGIITEEEFKIKKRQVLHI